MNKDNNKVCAVDGSGSQLKDLSCAPVSPFFDERLRKCGVFPLISKDAISTMQMNICRICNLSCKHCHVQAGPNRTEAMPREVMAQGLRIMAEHRINNLDITGGAPELNPHFQWLIEEAARIDRHIIVRTNLTVMDSNEFEHIPEFLAMNGAELVCSLPYYSEKDADRVRGAGVFRSSIKMLRRLNGLGYGIEGSGLTLNLMYNPGGAFLPATQQGLESEYRRALQGRCGVVFSNLFTLGNFPVGRFLTFLIDSGNIHSYMERLANAFNPDTIPGVMCRDQISLSWDGYLYDCDFNQMLGLQTVERHVSDCKKEDLFNREIAVHNHCYACTAGNGSSCGGAIV